MVQFLGKIEDKRQKNLPSLDVSMAVGPPPKASRKGSPALVSCSAALSNFDAKISKASPPLSAVFCVLAARLSNCSSGLYASLVGNSAPGVGLVDLAVSVVIGSPKSPSRSEAKGPPGWEELISVVVNSDCAADVCMGVENGAIAVSATEKKVDSVTDVDNCSVVENNSLLDDCNVSDAARSMSTPALSVSLPTAPVVDETEGFFSLATDAVS